MKLQVDAIDILPKLRDEFEKLAREIVESLFNNLMTNYMKQKELPRYMNKKQACQYMNTSFPTLKNKYIANGLRVITIDREEKIDQKDADAFMEKHKS